MTKTMTPIKNIRQHCLSCSGNQYKEVKHCGATACSLWPYRNGRRPTPEDVEEHLQAKANQCQRNREMKERRKIIEE